MPVAERAFAWLRQQIPYVGMNRVKFQERVVW